MKFGKRHNHTGTVNEEEQSQPEPLSRNIGHVRPANMQISLRTRSIWSDSSMDTFWVAKEA